MYRANRYFSKNVQITGSSLDNYSVIEILKKICDYFSLGSIDQFSEAGGIHKNYIVVTSSGEFVVKIILHCSLHILQKELVYLERIEKYHFSIPHYILSPNSSPAFEGEDFIAVVMRKLPGVIPYPTIDINRQVGLSLALLHTIPIYELPQKSHWLDKNYLPQMIQFAIKTFGKKKIAKFVNVYNTLRGFNPDTFPQSIIHGDLNPSNCLFIGDSLSVILDWEDIGIGASILDFAWTILSFCFIKQSDGKRRLDPVLYKSLFQGYSQIRIFTNEEVGSIHEAIRYMGLTFYLWMWLKNNSTLDLNEYIYEQCYSELSEILSFEIP